VAALHLRRSIRGVRSAACRQRSVTPNKLRILVARSRDKIRG
jgi:hypothetical protein